MSKNTNRTCAIQKLIIVGSILFGIIAFFPPLIVIIVIIFLKTDYDLDKVIHYFGIDECIKNMFPGKEKEYKNYIHTFSNKIDNYKHKHINKNKSKNTIKSDYVKIMSSQENKIEKTSIDTSSNNNRMNYTPSRISRPFVSEYKFKNNKRNTSYNNGRSIWDDYESVLDKIK